MLAGQNLGRREQRGLRSRFHRRQHRAQRDKRLARSDIALQHAQHRRILRHVARDLAPDALLGAGQAKRQPQRIDQPPVAPHRPPPPIAQSLPDQHQRDLARQYLVVGEPVARRFVARAGVGALHRIAPRRPVPARQQRRVDPFGKFGLPLERHRRQLRQPRIGQPFGQRIDGLMFRNPGLVTRFGDMVGVHDLAHIAIKIEPPRHPALLPEGEQLARQTRRSPEIDQPHMVARRVERLDPEGRARRSAGAVILRGQIDDDRLSRLRLIEPFDGHARNQAGRQMEQHIDNALESQPRERLGKLRTDTLEVGQGGKERVEDFGSHG